MASSNSNPCWPPDQEIWRCFLDDSCKKWGSRNFSGKCPQAVGEAKGMHTEGSSLLNSLGVPPWSLGMWET